MDHSRLKNKLIAKIIARFPFLSGFYTVSLEPEGEIPWTPVKKSLCDSTVSIVTTSGVHDKKQKPFDMKDPDGDPSFRVIDAATPLGDLVITHDYYDHSDADKDINIVFPLERFREFETEGIIGKVADRHYGLMGHILGRHIETLISKTAPEIARQLKADGVDVVLLTPG